jgi:FkbM family methyltransferase
MTLIEVLIPDCKGDPKARSRGRSCIRATTRDRQPSDRENDRRARALVAHRRLSQDVVKLGGVVLSRRRAGGKEEVANVFLPKPRLLRRRRRRPTNYAFPSSCQIPGLVDRYRELFAGVKVDGTFVEVGAYNGEDFSNTSGLADLGWVGLYIEPVPRYAHACARRHAVNREVRVASCAIGSEVGEIDLYLGEGLSTVLPAQVDVYEQIDWTRGFHTGERVRVKQFPLEHLLLEAGVEPGFDLLVVDVEGAEDVVLSSFSLEHWKPRVMIIELVDHHPSFQPFDDVVHRSASLRGRIKGAGYSEYYLDDVNTIFVRGS